MAMITVNYGQCGNQVVDDFLKLLSRDIQSNVRNLDYCADLQDRWFSRRSNQDQLYARALLVDTEPKVVNYIYRKQLSAGNCTWRYRRTDAIILKGGGGAANNWSCGHGEKGPAVEEQVLDAFRQETERCDQVTGILNLLSVAGGTGSGVGSYMVERLRDEYPTKTMINGIVLPFRSGEVVTQNYNSILTLAKLYDAAGMTIVFENDYLLKMTASLLGKTDINFNNLNELIAIKMAAILQPAEDSPCNVSDLVSHLASHPEYKLITIKTSPHISKTSKAYESLSKWNTLVKHIIQTLRVYSIGDRPAHTDSNWEITQIKYPNKVPYRTSLSQYTHCVANAVITRGCPSNSMKDEMHQLNNTSMYPKWLPEKSRIYHAHQSNTFLGMDKFIALATNNSTIHHQLNAIAEEALETYKSKAFLHHYLKYGISETDFIEAFSKLEHIIKSYKVL